MCINLQAACLEVLIVHGADVTISDSSGDTAVQIAELYGREDCLAVIRNHSITRKEL